MTGFGRLSGDMRTLPFGNGFPGFGPVAAFDRGFGWAPLPTGIGGCAVGFSIFAFGFGRLSGLIRTLPFGSLLLAGGLGPPTVEGAFEEGSCAGGFGLAADFADGAGGALGLPPAAGRDLGAPLEAGSALGPGAGFFTGAEGLTAVFCAPLTGPSAANTFRTPSP